MSHRLFFMDNLKWAIIWLMVVFHAAMCYMAYAPEWWYVVDKAEPVFSATVFICWADIFSMPVMFFISGYFGLQSLTRHGAATFWKKKFLRIFLPWVFGAVFLAPPITYIILASRHVPMDFWTFYTTLFWGPLYEQAAYWYLGALLALYVLLQLAVLLCPSLARRTPRRPGALYFLALFALSALSIGVINAYMPLDTWKFYAYLLVLQPVRIPTYILIFFAGAWAYRCHWFEPTGYTPQPVLWSAAAILFSLLYLWERFQLPGTFAPDTARYLNALAQGGFHVSAVFALLAVFRRCLDYTSPLLSQLSKTSYGVYYLHMLILFPVAWIFCGISLPVYPKYFLVCAISLAICYLLTKHVLLHIPCFGGEKQRKGVL